MNAGKKLLSRSERDARDASICHAYQTGLSYKQITKSMQVTTGMICRALRKGGVLARPTRYKPRKPLPYAERPPKSRYLDGHRDGSVCALYVKAMCSGEVKPEVDTGFRLCQKHRTILADIAAGKRKRKAA